jgi:hypothetical protein
MNHRQPSTSTFAIGALAVGLSAVGLSACNPNVTIGTLGAETTGSGSPGAGPQGCMVSVLAPARLDPDMPESGATAIGYADGWVYFASTPHVNGVETTQYKSEIWRVPVTGGTPVELASGIPAVVSLAVNATDVFIGDIDGAVWRMPVSGGPPNLVFHGVVTDPQVSAWVSLAITSTDLVIGNSDGSLRHAPITGGSAVELYPTTPGEAAIQVQVDATNVYWVTAVGNFGPAYVRKVPLAGGKPTVLATLDPIGSIALDGDYLYATSLGWMGTGEGPSATGDGTILRMRTDQSEPTTTIASNQPQPFQIAADATGAYWGNVLGLPPLNHVAPDGSVGAISPIQRILSMTTCADGVCWIDARTSSVIRYQECSP